jgi:hypothetical protein
MMSGAKPMATGTCYYWNGSSGWIKQTGVEEMPTVQSNDCMIVSTEAAAADGVVAQGCTVNFSIDADHEPWLARDIVVI